MSQSVRTRLAFELTALSLAALTWAAGRGSAPCATVTAAVRPSTWVRVETSNFSLLGEVPEARLRAIGGRLEAFRGTLEWLHPGSRTSPRETVVYVFKDAESGIPYTPKQASGDGHLGVNPPYDVGNYVTVAAPDDDPPLEVLYHAYAHQFLDDNFPKLPLLVTEGLAGVYTGFSVVPEGTLVGLVNSDHVRWLREHAALPLEAQIGADAPSLRSATTASRRTFVAGSWAFMHYLVSGSGDRRAGVPVFLAALQRGSPPAEAAQAAFGAGLDALHAAVLQYVQGGRFLPMRTTDGTVNPDATAFLARSMPRDEVLAVLADLIAHTMTDHDADAEAYLREALRLNPGQARAHAALGYLRYARDRHEEAIPHLEKASEIQPDGMSCYLLARSLLKVNAGTAPTASTPPWLAQARILLARATVLRPGFAAPYVILGMTHIRPDGDPASGIEVLQKARGLLPARTDIAGSLVYLYLRAGDLTRAQAMADHVLERSGDEETLRAARAAIATYKKDVAARQSVAKSRKTPAEAAVERNHRAAIIAKLRESLSAATDPEERERIQREIERLEKEQAIDPAKAVEIYNEAIAHANKRDYGRAIALLEDLQAKGVNDELREMIATMLERFRQDASRLQESGP